MIDLKYFIPGSASIQNTTWIMGLVVFVGKHTKVIMNTQKRKFKRTTVEKYLEKYIALILIILFLMILFLCIWSVISDWK